MKKFIARLMVTAILVAIQPAIAGGWREKAVKLAAGEQKVRQAHLEPRP